MSELLPIKQAAHEVGISEKTIRRAIQSGRIPFTTTKTTRNQDQYFVTVEDALQLKQPNRTAATKPSIGVDKVPVASNAVKKKVAPPSQPPATSDPRLLEAVEKMAAELAQARHEIHDLRGQLAQMHDQVIRALPAPQQLEQPRPWWKFWSPG